MKMRIRLILALMSLCVGGIIGLQLFWNYQNYNITVQRFEHDINAALSAAVDQEMGLRQQQLVNQLKGWLADTTLIRITCDTKSRDTSTVFYVQDRYPKYADSKPFSLGLTYFNERLDHLTPLAKETLIQHIGDRIAKADLQKGIVYYYTPRLGDSLQRAFTQSQVHMPTLERVYKKRLLATDVHASFELVADTTLTTKAAFSTRPVNAALRRPYDQVWIQARFERPGLYFLKTMRGVVAGTFLLIAITLTCFAYTAQTLFSQRKLAALKDNFINNMTHELNTPLASIRLTAEALSTFDYPPPVQREYLAIILYQTQKLTELAAQVLSANRLIAHSRLDWHRLEVHPLLTKAIDDLSVQCQQQQAQIHYQAAGTPLWIRGQAASLISALTNLIDNAIKYSSSPAQVFITAGLEGRYVTIAVVDYGLGIPSEYAHQVFDAFFRLPQGNVHNVKGYGLGLSHVRQVINQHRGSVSVKPNQPRGSRFTVRLPLA